MVPMKKFAPALLAALMLGACVTPTVYAPATGRNAVGFSEQRIQSDRWRVTYRGGGGAPAAQVQDYALLRAAELALANGYDWFRVDQRWTDQTGYQGANLGVGVGGASFGRHSAVGVGVSQGIPLNGGPQLTAVLEVSMGKGAPPTGRDVYDAREVEKNVRPRT
jgi:hypothetical protein